MIFRKQIINNWTNSANTCHILNNFKIIYKYPESTFKKYSDYSRVICIKHIFGFSYRRFKINVI